MGFGADEGVVVVFVAVDGAVVVTLGAAVTAGVVAVGFGADAAGGDVTFGVPDEVVVGVVAGLDVFAE